MSQSDISISNISRAAYRALHNLITAALASNFSGAAAPANPVAGQSWLDTVNGYMRQRNIANNAWVPPLLEFADAGTSDIDTTLPINRALLSSLGQAVASQAEAEAGVDNTKMMTPLRAFQQDKALGLPRHDQRKSTSAGSTSIVEQYVGTYVTANNIGRYVGYYPCLQSGNIRVQFDQKETGSGTCTAYVYRKRNGSVATMATWTRSSSTTISRSIDFWTTYGDLVYVYYKHSTTSYDAELKNIRIRHDGSVFIHKLADASASILYV